MTALDLKDLRVDPRPAGLSAADAVIKEPNLPNGRFGNAEPSPSSLPAGGKQRKRTKLTPNGVAIVVASGDRNESTQVKLEDNAGNVYWSPLVSASILNVTNSMDRGNQVLIYQAGLTVTFLPGSQGRYTVLLDGPILDDNDQYHLTGESIGNF